MSRMPSLPFDAADSAPAFPDAADRAAAVDPSRNVVLEASAGTGKTNVLVSRYVNLLTAGVDPSRILAITFTRKAAAEMRERIVSRLREAARIGEIDPPRWRDLRGRLGEVAISTIDAFCLALLREFPLEADLDPGFGLADETETVRLRDDALDRAIRTCRAIAQSDPAVELVMAQLGDAALRSGLAELLDRRLVTAPALSRFVRPGGPESPAALCQASAARLGELFRGVEGGLERFLSDGPLRDPAYAMLADDIRRLAATRSEGGREWARRLRVTLEALREHFLTAAGSPRTRWPRYRSADAVSEEAWRRHRARAAELATGVREELARFRRDLNALLARGVWRILAVALDAYQRTLDRRGVLDFPEVLAKSLQLLRQMDEFAQSRFLLESRYHHLLIDEFQDTSDAQWELIWRLVEAWGAGLGTADAAPLEPSIFVVGDRKQSIYGFRDADPSGLERAAAAIAGLRTDPNVHRSIRYSFRAVPALLAFVNDLFAGVEKARGRSDAFVYGESDRFPVDVSAFEGEPPVGVVVGRDVSGVAQAVAREVAALLESAQIRDRRTGLTRRVEPGDVAILFRSREGHHAFEQALEAAGIRAYVYKGLGFFDTDEIQDVFALLRYLADPASDLRAAALLRSRFIRLSDPALQRLAPGFAAALRRLTDVEPTLDEDDRAALLQARVSLARWLALVDRVPPAELLDGILRESAYAWELAGARAAQARENLKKIRSVIRRIQNRGYSTMARVAAHLDRLSAGDESNAAIDAVDAVSLMTVHAAKGLEFPVVFVVNLGRGTGGSRAPIRVSGDAAGRDVSVSVGDYTSDADEDAIAKEREETKRLLYVAVTRARDRLYLCASYEGDRFRPARGSLAEVLPASFLSVIHAARESRDSSLEWIGAAARHRIRLCRPPPNVAVGS